MEEFPSNAEKVKEEKVRLIIDTFKINVILVFMELESNPTKEKEAEKALLGLMNELFKNLDQTLGNTGECPDEIYNILHLTFDIKTDPGGVFERVYAAAITFLSRIRIYLIEYYSQNSRAKSIPKIYEEATNEALRAFKFKPDELLEIIQARK